MDIIFFLKRVIWGGYIVSSLFVVNLWMLLYAVFVLPVSSLRYRKLNEQITKLLWPFWTYGLEYLAGNRLHFYGAAVDGKENVFVLANHTYWCDWMMAFALATRLNKVGVIKLMVKELIRWIPGVGTGLMGCGCIFLSRHWPADRPAFIRACSPLLNDPLPFWLLYRSTNLLSLSYLSSHPEGSRVTRAKLAESQAFAKERNLPVLQHVLLPRVKGFQTTVQTLGNKIDAIYDITIAYSSPAPGPVRIICGPSNMDVHIYITRIPMKEIPRSEEEMGKWLYALYEQKDKLMAHWKQHGTFPGGELSMPFDHRKCEKAFYTWTPLMLSTLLTCFAVWRTLRRFM